MIIHRKEETRAKSRPKVSTRNPMVTPGTTCATVYSMVAPFRIRGVIEATMRNLTMAAAKVHASLMLGRRVVISKGVTMIEIKTARNGLMDTMVVIFSK